MTKYRTEYRINKKGAECFRTMDHDVALARFKELSGKRPGIYTIQSRHVQIDRRGVPELDWRGMPAWSCWS